MNALLIYPNHPDTFWSFKHALKFVSKKASEPPLGLLTVAALLPQEWNKKLIDMKVDSLDDKALQWADIAFISAMSIQKESVRAVVERCRRFGLKIVAGGPLFTMEYQNFEGIDHFVLNEAEITLPPFLKDLENGCPKAAYRSAELPSLDLSPIPMWELIHLKKYNTINIQYSRGCPYDCEFCDISLLFGNQVRTKNCDRFLAELDRLHEIGWRGTVFIVDDNFIGSKIKLKKVILPSLILWQQKHKYPFSFTTEASVDLSDDNALMVMMAMAGFNSVFVGIETPNETSLSECNKLQNRNRNLTDCVKKLHEHGMMVNGGFIVGFDNDPPTIFDQLIHFIQDSSVVTVMVGLLNAPRGTRLYNRLVQEKRLLNEDSGDNTDYSINFIPKMGREKLIDGYRDILRSIYSPKPYYRRVRKFLSEFNPLSRKKFRLNFRHITAFLKSVVVLGFIGRERLQYWRLLFWTLFKQPKLFSYAVTFAIYGFHFRKVFKV